MKVEFPGLIIEKLPSGNSRIRVRVEGDKTRRIRLHVALDHKDFLEHYRAARQGVALKPDSAPEARAIRGSIAWLVAKYLAALTQEVEDGLASKATLTQRRSLLGKLVEDYGDYSMDMPTSKIVELRNAMQSTPAAADNLVKGMRSMYRWACKLQICDVNPATGVTKIDAGKGGATAWTIEDLNAYRRAHPPGTPAHLCLTLFMFTACRISDAVKLGRSNEFMRGDIRAIGWQPQKKGSASVEIPMLPPLYRATRAVSVVGETYLLKENGQPFSSPEGLRNRLKKWCDAAGIGHLSSHGIRKAAGHLLAQEGCTQYQIMAVHGHTQAKTSEIYTKGVERWNMAADAMSKLEGMKW
ncbi:MAG: tyrosine-type recombinase/integrase [Parvibaculaceae bacterium]|nr:tyrosine-type recombinase/integrase [Parvibaculaceae bacterium]